MNLIQRFLVWRDRRRRPRMRPPCPDCGAPMSWAPFDYGDGHSTRLYCCSRHACTRIVGFHEAFRFGWLTWRLAA